MLKVKVRWAGFLGSPGWSNFYFDTPEGTFPDEGDGALVADKVATFFTAIKNNFNISTTWTIQSDVDLVHATSGELYGSLAAGPRPPITGGTAVAPYSAASGAVVTWRTGGVHNGRRVRGRTFLVPAATAAYQTDGTILDTALTTFQNAANALAAQTPGGVNFGVWHRNSGPGIEDGEFHFATGASVPDKVAILRSRRD